MVCVVFGVRSGPLGRDGGATWAGSTEPLRTPCSPTGSRLARKPTGRVTSSSNKTGVEGFFDRSKSDINRNFTDKLEVFKRCIANSRITLETELRVYEYCPAEGQLFNDFLVQ